MLHREPPSCSNMRCGFEASGHGAVRHPCQLGTSSWDPRWRSLEALAELSWSCFALTLLLPLTSFMGAPGLDLGQPPAQEAPILEAGGTLVCGSWLRAVLYSQTTLGKLPSSRGLTLFLLPIFCTVFRQLNTAIAVSQMSTGQCRLAPLIQVIQDCSHLYHYTVKLLFKLHSCEWPGAATAPEAVFMWLRHSL